MTLLYGYVFSKNFILFEIVHNTIIDFKAKNCLEIKGRFLIAGSLPGAISASQIYKIYKSAFTEDITGFGASHATSAIDKICFLLI